jgi:hypothetical protein
MDATRSLITLTCHHCGEPFQRLRCEHAKRLRQGGTKWFCGGACFAASLRRSGRPCMVCGKPTGSNDRRRFYCSPECKATTRPAKREKGCPRCGIVFAYSSSRRVYCSKVCADQAHAVRMTGRGNSRYKDGTSYADWFRKMRPLIKERDGDVCRVCSTVRPRMVVHHIDERPWNNWPTNLIYLCGSCHAVHHKSAVTPFPWFADRPDPRPRPHRPRPGRRRDPAAATGSSSACRRRRGSPPGSRPSAPLWFLTRNPDRRIALVSYQQDLADQFGSLATSAT